MRIADRVPPGHDGPMAAYMRAIDEIPLLTADEEVELGRRARDGDAEARERMIRANLRLVVFKAVRYTVSGLPLADRIGDGNLGLIEAVDKFDPERGVRFSTFASWWIMKAMRDARKNTARSVRIPSYMIDILSKCRRASAAIAAETGHVPPFDEVVAGLGLKPKQRAAVIKAAATRDPTLRLAGAECGDIEPEDTRDRPADEAAILADDIAALLSKLGTLDARSLDVLRMRFGLDGGEAMTLDEVGKVLGITRERTRQLEKAAKAAMASVLRGKTGE